MKEDKIVVVMNTDLNKHEVEKFIEKINKSLPKYKHISDFEITSKKIK